MLAPYVFARNMFDDMFNSAFGNHTAEGMMRTDIKESNEGYEMIIDIPGVKRENLTAELKDGNLIISASIGHDNNGESQNGAKYIRRERFVGSYKRNFYVGEALKQEDIRAKFENGTLHLFIPKKPAPAPVEEKNYIAIED